jgi:hypothetical protein
MIGEAANKLIGYLTMTSRKMPDPLALLTLPAAERARAICRTPCFRSAPTRT